MANPLPDALRPTSDEQNARLAELLGTTVDKLCPGLQKVTILKILDENHPGHNALLETLAQSSRNIQSRINIQGPTAETFRYLLKHIKIEAADVIEYWQKFSHGIQYGYEHGPKWDVPGRPDFVVGSTRDIQGMTPEWYVRERNIVQVGGLAVFWDKMKKQIEKMAGEGDALAISFLQEKAYEYPIEIHALRGGLEEIGHAHQQNSQKLRGSIDAKEREVFSKGRPKWQSLSEADRKNFYAKDPSEIQVEEFIEANLDGAVERFKKTQQALAAAPSPPPAAPPFSWTSEIIASQAGGSGPSPSSKHT